MLYTRTTASGVQFFLRPQDNNPGESLTSEIGILSNVETSTGTQLRELTIVIPPDTVD